MKKFKHMIFLFFFVCFLFACKSNSNKLIQIQVKDFVNESTIVDVLKIEDYKLILYYSDGTKEYVDITYDMVDDNEEYKLSTEGSHNLEIKYNNLVTEISFTIIKSNLKYRFDYYLQELDGTYIYDSSESFNSAYEIEFDFNDYTLKEFDGFTLEERYELVAEKDTKVYQFFYTRNKYNLNIYIDEKIVYTKTFTCGEKINLDFQPTKENYNFVSFDNNVPEYMGTTDINLISKFEPIMLTYRFLDYDGSLIKETTAIKGSLISIPDTPKKYNDEKYTYIFEKWNNYHNGMILNDNIDFTAVYSVYLNEYSVTFKNIDETILYVETVKYGQTAIYNGELPVRPTVEDKSFVFIGWDKDLNNITFDLVVYPLYEDITNKVLVNIVVDSQSSIQYVEIGSDAVLPNTPYKEGYTFKGWDKTNLNITESTTITAIFEINYYNISYNIDGELFGDVERLPFGSELETKNAPIKEGHIFIGWSNEIDNVPASDYIIYGHYVDVSQLNTIYDGIEKRFIVYDSYKDYSIKYYCNNELVRNALNAGKYKVVFDYLENNDSSYTFEYEFTIQKGYSVITANNVDVIYDGNSYSIEYFLNHDEAVIETSLNSFVNAGEYFVTISVPETVNYFGCEVVKTINIRKNSYDISSISFDEKTYVYDGNEKTLKILGDLPEGLDVEYSLNSLTNVGSIDVTATFIGDFENFNVVEQMVSKLTISKRDAIIKIDNQESYYGETLNTITYNLVNVTDDLPIEIIKEDGLTVGEYQLTTDYENENYNFTIIDGVYTIKRAIYNLENIKFNSETYVYDGLEKEVTISGILPNGLSVSYENNKLKNAGSTTAVAIFSGDFENYYPVENMECILEITRKDAYIIIDNKSSVVGNELDEFTSTKYGFIESDNIVYEIIKEEGLKVGTYKLTTLYENPNYNINIINGEYQILAHIFDGIKFENKVVEYDGSIHSLDIVGVSDNLEVEISNNSFTNVGVYEVKAKITDGVDEIELTATLTITKKDATIIIDSKNSVYGNDLVQYTYTSEGFIESVEIEILKEQGLNAGEYKLYTNYSNENYNICYINGIYTIEKANPVITINTDKTLFIYNGEEHHISASLNHNECELKYINNNRIATGNYELKVISEETQNYNYGEISYNYAIKYVVNFYDNEGLLIYTTYALLNESVIFPLEYPIGESTDFYYYEFNNWNKNIDCIKENIDVYPEFKIQPINYIVIFVDVDGNVIKEVKDLSYGEYVEEPLKAIKKSSSANLAYVFSMWNPVDYDSSVKTSNTERTVTVSAIYDEVAAVAKINNNYYGSIVDALYDSSNGDVVIVINSDGGNYLINEDAVIKEGVTLYLPYAEGISVTEPNNVLYNGTFSKSNCYLNVTLLEATLTILGDLVIGAVTGNTYYNGGNFLQGVINGAFSKITMENSSHIIVGNETCVANLLCYGIIEDISSNNSASITVNRYSVLSENFVIYDWRNENYMISNFYNRSLVSPFNRYQLPYIDVQIKFNYGSLYQGIGKVYSVEMGKFYGMPFTIIGNGQNGSKGMFSSTDSTSYITKLFKDTNNNVSVNSYTDNLQFDLYGDININSLNIFYNQVLYSTELVYFPIPYSMSISLHNCSLVLSNKYKLLPGAKFIIDSNSMVVIKTNNIKEGVEPSVTAGLAIYESYEFSNAIDDIYPNSSQLLSVNKNTYGELINNGKIVVDSNFVYIGGKITGTGELIKNYATYKALMREIPNFGNNSTDMHESYLILYFNSTRIGDSKTGTFK